MAIDVDAESDEPRQRTSSELKFSGRLRLSTTQSFRAIAPVRTKPKDMAGKVRKAAQSTAGLILPPFASSGISSGIVKGSSMGGQRRKRTENSGLHETPVKG